MESSINTYIHTYIRLKIRRYARIYIHIYLRHAYVRLRYARRYVLTFLNVWLWYVYRYTYIHTYIHTYIIMNTYLYWYRLCGGFRSECADHLGGHSLHRSRRTKDYAVRGNLRNVRMYVCMYCMCCMYVCNWSIYLYMYVCIYMPLMVSTALWWNLTITRKYSKCMYTYTYVRMHVCMYVCM
jgi:hypothetical protein